MEILTPPYPLDGCTVRSLLINIGQLYDWIMEHKAFALEANKEYQLGLELNFDMGARPSVEKDEKRLLACPIAFIYADWKTMRGFREAYDKVVRDYEESWDSPNCVKSRATGVQAAIYLYSKMFVTYEGLEAEMEQKLKAKESQVANMLKMFITGLASGNVQFREVTKDELHDNEEEDNDQY